MEQRSETKHCFHCGLSIPNTVKITVTIDDNEQPMCCHGCQAVAQSIVDSGMTDFYRYRTDKPSRAEELVPEFLSKLQVYDNPLIQKQLVSEDGDVREISLILEGIVCAACIWLNEKTLSAIDGVLDVSINYTTHRARVKWNNKQLKLSAILEAISRIGYMAHPYDPERHQLILEKERKTHLRRLGISAIFGMQIMILAVAMYTGEWWGMDVGFMETFRWASLALCIPILLFSSNLFFQNAWRDLMNKRVGMDVPVALGMGIAFIASVYHTLINQGAVYYDSVSMFTFFLLIARYFEMIARKRSSEHTESLLNLTPAVATKIEQTIQTIIPVAELSVGDFILVKPGESIAADGTITRGASGVNESLITGESFPVHKKPGDAVIGGSINTENSLVIEITHTGEDTVLASIHRLLDEAQKSKPSLAQLADTIAVKFVLAILFIAGSVAFYWYSNGSVKWLEYTVATLVVTCPCALSLATPTALTAASGELAKLGLLPLKNNSLETLANTTDFVFDKTGTLTTGEMSLKKVDIMSDINQEECLQIAAALEAESEHPLAKALTNQVENNPLKATNCSNTSGYGISGFINGEQWFIGNVEHLKQHCTFATDNELIYSNNNTDKNTNTRIYLASKKSLVAVFHFEDTLREQADELITQLSHQGVNIHLLSGDTHNVVSHLAEKLKIKNSVSAAKPDTKLDYIRQLQKDNKRIAMTGDGINDAPVLAGADVSIAMGSGSHLASASADMILLSNNIKHIASGFMLAKKTLRIIKQNLSWAITYNFLAIPAAAAGFVQPWLAAIGMSASSLIVVLNALRLSKKHD